MAQGLYLSQKMMLLQVLAPQLQQSLALLQAPTLELKALVEQELQQNPILEESPTLETDSESEATREEGELGIIVDPTEPPAELNFDAPAESEAPEPIDDFQTEFDRLTQLDQEWRDQFSQTNAPLRQSEDEEEKRQFMFESLTANASLQNSLIEQMRLSELPEDRWPIAEMIIGNIDDHGYLQASLDELAFSTNIPKEQIGEVLTVVQSFHPPGVGARDLRECLLLQLQRAGRENSLEYRIISEQMEFLGKRRLPEIARHLGLSIEEVQKATERISHLDPRPGRAFMPETPQYVVPEIFVQKVGDDFVVTVNNEYIPHLRISNTYKDLMSQANSSVEVREYIRDKIRAGKFLIKSLHQRQMTLLNIGREIVHRQREFFDKGLAHLRPMTMMQVAEVVGVHETTVSRAVSGKYMETPQGMFDMKFFFTSGIKTTDGVGMSNASIKDMVAELIKIEDTAKPLSDEELVKMLAEKGIVIARRTVAKYRSELNILPSNLRRVY